MTGCHPKRTNYVGPTFNEIYLEKGDVMIWRPYSNNAPPFEIYVQAGICNEGKPVLPEDVPSGYGAMQSLTQDANDKTVSCTVLKQNYGDGYSELPFVYFIRFSKDGSTSFKHGDLSDFGSPITGHVGSCGSCSSADGFLEKGVSHFAISSQTDRHLIVRCPSNQTTGLLLPVGADNITLTKDDTVHWDTSDPGSTLTIPFDSASGSPCAATGDGVKSLCVIRGVSAETKYQYSATNTFASSSCKVIGHITVEP